MSLPAGKLCTYSDLLEWDGPVRYELYNGQPMALASPSNIHQLVSGEIFRQLANYLVGKRCKAYPAPFDVRLFEEAGDGPEDVTTVVQPDISVVCGAGKTDGHGCKGAPDFVIEILSTSTAHYDRLVKFSLYQRAGVREYWIVDPGARVVQVHTLEDGAYHASVVYTEKTPVPVTVLEGCEVDLSTVFPEPSAI